LRGRAADTVERRLSRIDKERKRSDSLFVAEGKSPPVQYKLSANAVVARKFDIISKGHTSIPFDKLESCTVQLLRNFLEESFACERRKTSPLAASGATAGEHQLA